MAAGSIWTDEELKACVDAYALIVRNLASGRNINRSEIIRDLVSGALAARTEGSVGLRFGNISAVLEEAGKPYAQGLKPLRNVGSNSSKRIKKFLVDAGLI